MMVERPATQYSGKADVFSFGIVLYEMVYGKTPFGGEDRVDTFAKICDEQEKLRFPRHPRTSRACRRLLKKLLHKDPSRRVTSPNQIRSSKFFKGFEWFPCGLASGALPPFHQELEPAAASSLRCRHSSDIVEVVYHKHVVGQVSSSTESTKAGHVNDRMHAVVA